MENEQPRVNIPDMCQRHQSKLVRAAKAGPMDTWRAWVIGAQVAMFQAATCSASVHKKIKGKVEDIGRLGCLACRLPARFEDVLRAAATRDLGAVKRLGDGWVAAAGKEGKGD